MVRYMAESKDYFDLRMKGSDSMWLSTGDIVYKIRTIGVFSNDV